MFNRYDKAAAETRENLKSLAQSPLLQELSRLSLPQIDKAVEMVAQMMPANDALSVILSGLTHLPERKISPERAQKDTSLLFEAMNNALNTAFFAGPATVIVVYQSLLRLAGINPEDAFPHGTWQFYVEYALREDTARHCVETHGFDTLWQKYGLTLSQTDRFTAWVMAAIHTLHQYEALLRSEWRERVYLAVLAQLTQNEPEAERFAGLYRQWELQRPYGRGQDAKPQQTYPDYRRAKFDQFLEKGMHGLPTHLRRQWVQEVQEAKAFELPAYQEQLSILATLVPGQYSEARQPIELREAHIGLIYQGQYYLLPVCEPGSEHPTAVDTVRTQIASLLTHHDTLPPVQLMGLARLQRAHWPRLQNDLTPELMTHLQTLRTAPILLNFDQLPSDLPLARLRQTERGVGSHAMTIFDTGRTFVFDLSHIFFDGTTGAAIAEIMTNEATSWGAYLHRLPPAQSHGQRPFLIPFHIQPQDWHLIEEAPRITTEASADTESINLKTLTYLRKLFRQRSEKLELTVNDILVLYRAIHATRYQPSEEIADILGTLTAEGSTHPPKTTAAAQAALQAIRLDQETNPSVLIPVDASRRRPRDRVHPLSILVPLDNLNLLELHQEALTHLLKYQKEGGSYEVFDQIQRHYLGTLAGLGQFFQRAKHIAAEGKSTSVGTIKLLAHLPRPVQRLLDRIPDRFDVWNDILKGREVFSNVGAVAPTSTLTRFLTAKDDNEQKTLAWGIITTADGTMRLTLRDFRPHVTLLVAAGFQDLPNRIAQDYLDSYANGFNNFIRELLQITLASQDTLLPTSSEKK